MQPLIHRVKVFVYRYEATRPQYLLLRGDQGIESFWSPVHNQIGWGEKLETAIRRGVMDDTGLGLPKRVLDLEMPERWCLGDEEVVEWNYGFHTDALDEQLELSTRWADFRWSAFERAFSRLEMDHDRAAITRLHTLLASN